MSELPLPVLRSQAQPAWDKFTQTPLNRDSVQQLERLSSQLQPAGLRELGLLDRQLVVAHRKKSYKGNDLRFIKASLQTLML